MGVVNNEIRIAGLEASTAGIMTSVKAIEATTSGLMTSVRNAAAAAAAAQGAVDTLSGTVGGLVTDETKFNSVILKAVHGYETSKTGAELFDLVLAALYDNAGADTDYIQVLQMTAYVTASGQSENYCIMDNSVSYPVLKSGVNPSGSSPFDVIKIVGYDNQSSKWSYFSRTRNGGRVWSSGNMANILTTTFTEYDVYLWYELKKPYSVSTN